MASMEQRKRRRRRKFQRGNLMADSCELLNPGRKSADIEQLAHKYMQKCTVESSTESESDANTEVLPNKMLLERSRERTSHTKLQFLDPYDGDYEEMSGNSDSSLGSLDSSHSRTILLRHPSTEAWTPEDQEPLSATPARDQPQLYESAKVSQLTRESSWFMGPEHSKHAGISENTSSEFVLQPMLIECDTRLCEDLNVNRKQGRPVLESAGEKIRKKLRVI
ncbi:uncharacterized protein LOC133378434 [Rhineura floridana]|uniref:uncharacterized protein LOC133378434 n=1 Tax=Rhineura floridana TaxID=261503 RepID=UPI002AC824C0|nr:uncharacterized protein LOC133378434 [Rhineura floridana]